MTFDPAIPQGNHKFSRSHTDIRNNFTDLNNVLSEDHIQPAPIVAAERDHRGKHRRAVIRTIAPAPGTALGEGAIYVHNQAAARQQLYYRREDNGAQIPISMIGGFAVIDGVSGLVIAGSTSFNLTSARVGGAPIGRYLLTFGVGTNMLDANYVAIATCGSTSAAGFAIKATVIDKAAGQFEICCRRGSTDALINPTTFSVIIFGEIAGV